MEEYSLGS